MEGAKVSGSGTRGEGSGAARNGSIPQKGGPVPGSEHGLTPIGDAVVAGMEAERTFLGTTPRRGEGAAAEDVGVLVVDKDVG